MMMTHAGPAGDLRGAPEARVGGSGLQRGGPEEREPWGARHLHPGDPAGQCGALVRRTSQRLLISHLLIFFMQVSP